MQHNVNILYDPVHVKNNAERVQNMTELKKNKKTKNVTFVSFLILIVCKV